MDIAVMVVVVTVVVVVGVARCRTLQQASGWTSLRSIR